MPPDTRVADILAVLEYAPFRADDVVLDIGMGDGRIAQAVAPRVRRVVGTGLKMQSYAMPRAELRTHHIDVAECVAERLPFADGQFGAIVMAHILEHCPNVGLALSEVRRVLAADGTLCVFVPPHETVVAAGHVSIGWSIGQLLYVLLLNGYDVKQGRFIRLGYNVCAFVRKELRPLPPLRHDRGDIRTLAADGRFPLPVATRDGRNDAFSGDLQALNWPWTHLLEGRRHGPRAQWLRRVLPLAFRRRLGPLFLRLGHVLTDDETQQINPARLQI
jgi:SAM-dependent methyltransferase